ncbi:MAG: hypothetical protein ACOC1T_03655, partial [Halorhodospira sp.]
MASEGGRDDEGHQAILETLERLSRTCHFHDASMDRASRLTLPARILASEATAIAVLDTDGNIVFATPGAQ